MAEPKTKPILVSRPELAHALALTEGRIDQLAADHVVVRKARGKYDLVASVRGYLTWIRNQESRKARAITKDSFRATLMQAKAERAAIETELMKRSVIKRDEAIAVAESAMSIVANHLDGLGGRVANECAALSDPALICDLIDREAREIRAAAARRIARLGSRVGDGGEADAPAAPDGGRVGGREARASSGLC